MSRHTAALSADLAGSTPASPLCQNPGLGRRPTQHIADDDTLAAMYIRMWSLATGRRLRSGVKPDQLTADELVEFWDDVAPVSGRHAAPDIDSAVDAR